MSSQEASTAATKAEMGAIIEWHRADRRHHMTQIWVTGFFLLFSGGCMVGFSFFAKDPGWMGALTQVAAIVGLALTVAGPVYCLRGFYLMLAQESWVAIHELGLRVSHDPGGELFIPWAILREVKVEGQTLTLGYRDEEIRLNDSFEKVSVEELATHIRTHHQKVEQLQREATGHMLAAAGVPLSPHP